MESTLYREYLLVKSGRVGEARLDESVRRVQNLVLVSKMGDWQQKGMAKVCCAIPIWLSTWRRMPMKNRVHDQWQAVRG